MKLQINPKYNLLSKFVNELPESFATNGEVIYQDRNIVKRFQVQGFDVVVKSFRKPIFVNRIAYTFLRKSKAQRSYEYGLEILKRGFDSPEPIAFLELYQNGLLSRSYFVSIFKAGTETVRQLMEGKVAGNEVLLTAFAKFTAEIHKAEILHIDYSPGNILYKTNENGDFEFSLIDINRLKFKSVNQEVAVVNLSRLCTSREVLSFIARSYANFRGWDETFMDMRMTKASDQFFKDYTFRLTRKAWRKKHILSDKNPVKVFRWNDFLSRISFLPIQIRKNAEKDRLEVYQKYLSAFDFRKVLK